MFRKTEHEGRTMWEDSSGERFFNPDEKPDDMYGWHKVEVDGRIMWESHSGERSY